MSQKLLLFQDPQKRHLANPCQNCWSEARMWSFSHSLNHLWIQIKTIQQEQQQQQLVLSAPCKKGSWNINTKSIANGTAEICISFESIWVNPLSLAAVSVLKPHAFVPWKVKMFINYFQANCKFCLKKVRQHLLALFFSKLINKQND